MQLVESKAIPSHDGLAVLSSLIDTPVGPAQLASDQHRSQPHFIVKLISLGNKIKLAVFNFGKD